MKNNRFKKIKTVIRLPHKAVVLSATDSFKFGDSLFGRNLLGYDKDRNLAWRVEGHGAIVRARPEDKVTKPDEDGVDGFHNRPLR